MHKKWVETIGKEGEMLKLDEVDLRSFDVSDVLLEQAYLIDCNLINVSFYLTDLSWARLENIDISVATFEETLLNGVTLKNIKGIEEAHIKSINIGTLEKPILLKSDEAKKWMLEKCEVSF
ncbi:pentapeptide repeat-containing protein [Paenibacillus silvae]|uniref:pentapeptide repeat-containing protein n=1 Tax=Paenibacillus silvae TaxID=1325358 RepID=UPI0025A0A511|nr:pentapeptide repeat-containing protein [Paenibacillus silvae]MDM5280263.1 pentapeptide repeat-containing protein [Paenibacillus silvae]